MLPFHRPLEERERRGFVSPLALGPFQRRPGHKLRPRDGARSHEGTAIHGRGAALSQELVDAARDISPSWTQTPSRTSREGPAGNIGSLPSVIRASAPTLGRAAGLSSAGRDTVATRDVYELLIAVARREETVHYGEVGCSHRGG